MISRDEIGSFFEQVHGHRPFPWQLDLADAALADRWPDAVDAPTGLGKTWSIDVAVLAMAAAGLRGHKSGLRRVYFVVDRRTVVDEAYEHTRHLAAVLREAPAETLVGRIATGLRALIGGTAGRVDPLAVTRMRGGTTWSSRWAERPDQPLVVLSTVDQVGSRLLFRGYGVSDGMRPIDAALVGCHSLFLLDEAHLSLPFADVLGLVRSTQTEALPVAGLKAVSLSATQARVPGVLSFDVAAHLADATAQRRLESDKRLAVLTSTVTARPKLIAATVRQLLTDGTGRVLVTCNTVAGARSVHSALVEQGVDAGLLTGRSRPSDRDLVVREWLPALGRRTDDDGQPRVLVATQTVEVGVNLDVDVLVTEECALHALVQRLGRVNRFGEVAGAAVVVGCSAEDPVYGAAASTTTTWLTSQGAPVLTGVRDVTGQRTSWLDVSPLALRALAARLGQSGQPRPEDLARAGDPSPMSGPGLLQGWAQTAPSPATDVPVEPFLHGLSTVGTTVVAAWRSDLGNDATLAVPLDPAETVELSRAALRGFLAGAAADETSDLEGTTSADEDYVPQRILRVLEGTRGEWTSAEQLRAGDTVVLPVVRGGLDRWGWHPESHRPVLDVADVVPRRRGHLVRIDERSLRPLVQGVEWQDAKPGDHDATWAPVARAVRRIRRSQGDDEDDADALAALADALREAAGPQTDVRLLPLIPLIANGRLDRLSRADGEDVSVVLQIPTPASGGASGRADTTDADDDRPGSTALLGQQVELDDHADAVGERAADVGSALGLNGRLTRTVSLAARWHDAGKVDPRFQAMLWGGVQPYGAAHLLAKSGVQPRSTAGRRAASIARYPARMRHEALSGRLVAAELASGGYPDVDAELLVHLVKSHHGRARPLMATTDDPDPRDVSWEVDGHRVVACTTIEEDPTAVRRFEDLNRRYGPWGLALLESIVRLADMACSSEGS